MMLRANLYPCYHLNSKKNFFTLCQYGNLPILSPCNVGDTLKPTQSPDSLHPFHPVLILRTRFRTLCRRSLLLSVHCSRATSATSSRRFPPAIFSLGIRTLHTPPCHCIYLSNLTLIILGDIFFVNTEILIILPENPITLFHNV